MYQIDERFDMIIWNDEGSIRWIPMDEANVDYQNYLDWVAAGNEPEVIE
jgi:hypothetical protein